MYISRPMLWLIIVTYLFVIAGMDWRATGGAPWYAPFAIGFLIVLAAGMAHRGRDSDEP